MPHFNYTARSKNGEKTSGRILASTKASALKEIEGMGLVPVTIEDINATTHAPTPEAASNAEPEKQKGGQAILWGCAIGCVLLMQILNLATNGAVPGGAAGGLIGAAVGAVLATIIGSCRKKT